MATAVLCAASSILQFASIAEMTVNAVALFSMSGVNEVELDSSSPAFAGFSDPVYAEAYVTVHQYDIVLDVSVINRTTETLQNLCLELATMGDLKLVERPQNYTLGPGAQKSIR